MQDKILEHKNVEGMEVKSRFTVSLFVNVLKGGLSFITMLVLARGLGPALYGDFAFLMGSFVAVKSLLDLGTSSAFYTFISQKPRGYPFIRIYMVWQLAQLTLALVIVGLAFPGDWIDLFWVGQKRELVLISLAGIFMQQQAWQTMIQIGESLRQTRKIQMINLFFSIIHLLIITVLWFLGLLSILMVFTVVIVECVIAICIAWKALEVSQKKGEPVDLKSVFNEYVVYCSPLIVYSLLGFAYNFADRWMLQSFGGSTEQGLFEIGYGFAGVSLVATTSMLNIFWKEISEAQEREDYELVHRLYRKISRFLFTLGALLCGFLIPWSDEIVLTLLGESYVAGAPVLVIMFLFAVFNSLAQINITLILASSKTKIHLVLGGLCMVASIPLSYFFQAPRDFLISGLELGAIGMACKMLIMIVIRSNLIGWWYSRSMGWKFDWVYQVVSLGITVLFGWGAFLMTARVLPEFVSHVAIRGVASGLIYSCLMVLVIWMMPWLVGMDRKELREQLMFFFRNFKRKSQ